MLIFIPSIFLFSYEGKYKLNSNELYLGVGYSDVTGEYVLVKNRTNYIAFFKSTNGNAYEMYKKIIEKLIVIKATEILDPNVRILVTFTNGGSGNPYNNMYKLQFIGLIHD